VIYSEERGLNFLFGVLFGVQAFKEKLFATLNDGENPHYLIN